MANVPAVAKVGEDKIVAAGGAGRVGGDGDKSADVEAGGGDGGKIVEVDATDKDRTVTGDHDEVNEWHNYQLIQFDDPSIHSEEYFQEKFFKVSEVDWKPYFRYYPMNVDFMERIPFEYNVHNSLQNQLVDGESIFFCIRAHVETLCPFGDTIRFIFKDFG